MDIFENQSEWIKASSHQAFTDEVVTITNSLIQSMYDQMKKAIGFELNIDTEYQDETENAFNSISDGLFGVARRSVEIEDYD